MGRRKLSLDIVLNDQVHGALLATYAGTHYNPAVDTCISTMRNDEVTGGVIYKDYTGASITMHVASFSKTWGNRDMLWVCFHYPFIQLNCRKVFGQVPADNCNALQFDIKLGFKEEARIKDVFPSGDLILLSMYREDCRWLSIKPRGLKGYD